MENEIHLTVTTDLPYHISFKPLQQFTDRQTDRQFIHYSVTLSTVSKEYIQKVTWPSRKYILIESLTSPLPTKRPERVVLAR